MFSCRDTQFRCETGRAEDTTFARLERVADDDFRKATLVIGAAATWRVEVRIHDGFVHYDGPDIFARTLDLDPMVRVQTSGLST